MTAESSAIMDMPAAYPCAAAAGNGHFGKFPAQLFRSRIAEQKRDSRGRPGFAHAVPVHHGHRTTQRRHPLPRADRFLRQRPQAPARHRCGQTLRHRSRRAQGARRTRLPLRAAPAGGTSGGTLLRLHQLRQTRHPDLQGKGRQALRQARSANTASATSTPNRATSPTRTSSAASASSISNSPRSCHRRRTW